MEPIVSEPIGSEPVGSEPIGLEPVSLLCREINMMTDGLRLCGLSILSLLDHTRSEEVKTHFDGGHEIVIGVRAQRERGDRIVDRSLVPGSLIL